MNSPLKALVVCSAAILLASHAVAGLDDSEALFQATERAWKLSQGDLKTSPDAKIAYEESSGATGLFLSKRFAAETGDRRLFTQAILAGADEGFRRVAYDHLVVILSEGGRRQELIELLRRRCRDRLFLYSGIEGLLIARSPELKDGTLVLCAAYQKSSHPEARQNIARALRRGFEALGLDDSDDDQLVQKCKDWYLSNREQVVPNPEYSEGLDQRDPAPSPVLVPKP